MPRENSNCTPAGLLDPEPCGLCLSDTQLMAVIGVLLCAINKELGEVSACTPEAMMEKAKCFKCESNHQMLDSLVAIIGNYAEAVGVTGTPGELIESASCMMCSEPKMLKAIALSQLCTLFEFWGSQIQP